MQRMLQTRFTRRAGGAAAAALGVPLFAGVRLAQAAPAKPGGAGAVYTLTNAAAGNAVAIFDRASDGSLSAAGTVATGGLGTGGGLGSQGALALSKSGPWLFAVNAGSDQISSLRLSSTGLALVQTMASGGQRPISLAVHDSLLYVLNAGGSGNITGFTIGANGTLKPLAKSTRGLAGAATNPAQVGFSPNGSVLVVTEKAANAVVTYTVGANGRPGDPVSHPSSGAVPFGFDFASDDTLVVSEASGGASSYEVDDDGSLQLRTGSLSDHQTAACWAVATENGAYAYLANAGSGSISGYRVARNGSLTLLNADGMTGVTGAGSHPTDEALSAGSKYLYVLLTPNSGTSIAGFAVGDDGSLQSIGTISGLPVGAVGLAAR